MRIRYVAEFTRWAGLRGKRSPGRIDRSTDRLDQASRRKEVSDDHGRRGRAAQRLLPPRLPFSSAESGASSRVAHLCARSGDRGNDYREILPLPLLLLLLSLRECIIESLPVVTRHSKKEGARKHRRTEVDVQKKDRRASTTRETRKSRWV